jgi:hypothetical protein
MRLYRLKGAKGEGTVRLVSFLRFACRLSFLRFACRLSCHLLYPPAATRVQRVWTSLRTSANLPGKSVHARRPPNDRDP